MGSGTPRKRSRLRIFLAAIIMVDMLRRILGGDVRVIDLWILLVDVLILLLIFIEDLVAFARWCKKRRDLSAEEKELRERLANLESSAVEGLRNFILKGQKPSDEICSALEQPLSLVERDTLRGWRVIDQHKAFLGHWASPTQQRMTTGKKAALGSVVIILAIGAMLTARWYRAFLEAPVVIQDRTSDKRDSKQATCATLIVQHRSRLESVIEVELHNADRYSDFNRALEALNVFTIGFNGERKDPGEVLQSIIEKISQMKDGARRRAMEYTLLSAGMDLDARRQFEEYCVAENSK